MRTSIRLTLVLCSIASFSIPAGSAEHFRNLSLRKAILDNKPERPDLPEWIEEVKNLAREEIIQVLNENFANPAKIEMEIRNVLQDEWAGSSFLRENLSGTEFFLIGYSIFHGSTALPEAVGVIEAFRKTGTRYESAGRTSGRLSGFSLRLDRLDSPWPNEVWILAHGQQTQVMQYHEKMAIYSFDGVSFREVWVEAEPRRDASYKVTPGSLLINYDDDSDGQHTWLTQKLYLTPGGVVESTPQLQNQREWKVASGKLEREAR